MKTRVIWTPTNVLVFFLMVIATFSCELEAIEDIDIALPPTSENKENCFGKDILKFDDTNDLQTQYNDLHNDYLTAGDETPLIAYEDSEDFYSLRKKEYEIDEGIIPDDPTFEAWDYSSDDVFSTLLNEEGMIIIDDELYLWSDGCIAYKAPFSCTSYEGLLALRDLMVDHYFGSPSPTLELDFYKIQVEYDISVVNICNNTFDFDGNAEQGDNRYLKSSNCGLNSFINFEIIENDPFTKKAVVRLEANDITFPGEMVFYNWYLPNITTEATIIDASQPAFLYKIWNELDAVANEELGIDLPTYTGKWFTVEVDYTALSYMNTTLYTFIDPISGNSCSSTDNQVIDLNCPINLTRKPLNASLGNWAFSIEGLPDGYSGSFEWNFGDGTVVVNTLQDMTHTYPIPCSTRDFNVTVTLMEANPGPCKTVVTTNILVVAPCNFNKRRLVNKGKEGGKRWKTMIKIKPNGKLKHKFRWRKNGTKTIQVLSGDVWYATGWICNNQSLATLMPTVTQSGKKKLKQKMKNGTIYYFDANAPYVIRFSHDSGFVNDMQFNVPCVE